MRIDFSKRTHNRVSHDSSFIVLSCFLEIDNSKVITVVFLVMFQSIVHLVFREEKDPRNELAHWQYWHAQQPNPNQKAFDIDRNKCQNIEKFDEVGYNAVGFIWSADQKAKVLLFFIRCFH